MTADQEKSPAEEALGQPWLSRISECTPPEMRAILGEAAEDTCEAIPGTLYDVALYTVWTLWSRIVDDMDTVLASIIATKTSKTAMIMEDRADLALGRRLEELRAAHLEEAAVLVENEAERVATKSLHLSEGVHFREEHDHRIRLSVAELIRSAKPVPPKKRIL